MLQDAKRVRRKTSKRHRSFERLELRQLMAVDVNNTSSAKNWVPEVEEIRLDPLASSSFQASSPSADWKKLLAPQASKLFQGGADAGSFRVTSARRDASIGATYVYLQETFNGLDVVNAYANLTVLDNGQVFNASSSFVPTSKFKNSVQSVVGVSPEQALANIAQEYGWEGLNLSQVSRSAMVTSGKKVDTLRAPTLARVDVPFESVYIPTPDGRLDIGWRLNVQASRGEAWLDATVSSTTGQVLHVADWSSDAQYQVFALPKESPDDGPRTTLTNPQLAAYSPFGWHDTNGVAGAESTLTVGNNTRAYLDVDGNDFPDTNGSPSGGAGLVFTPALDLTKSPSTNASASTVNLFYVTNVLHDVFAAKGFTAAAGNFQKNNYDAGGVEGDPLLAENRDGAGLNNANMSTPPDGFSPRMQMFDWTSTQVFRSGSLDNGIIAHEFGHGVTNRLTGGPANSSALSTTQARGLGEGWSDFFALMFTQNATDVAGTNRTIGNYVLGESSTGLGLRSQPYNYSKYVNTSMFGDLQNMSQVHDIGEVWATVLWDLNWALIKGSSLDPAYPNAGLGFNSDLSANSGGNNMALRLVVQALKLQPANPTFLQARDAILDADRLLNAGQYQQTIWQVFARRGMGTNAKITASLTSPITESFDVPIGGQLNYIREGMLGSNISRVSGEAYPILTAGGQQRFQFAADVTSKLSFTVTPDDPLTVLNVRLLNAANGTVLGPITGAAGQKVAIAPWTAPTNGNYTLVVTSSRPTGLRFESARNAALESQVGDSSSTSEMDITSSQRAYNTGSATNVVGSSLVSYKVVKGNSASKFVDISGFGTKLLLDDEEATTITTTVGNEVFPAGRVSIVNNGALIAASGRNLGFDSRQLSTLPTAPASLVPFWDDLDSGGAVYWTELPVNGVNTLIVQWNDKPRFINTGAATFQVQVPSSGTLAARFAYQDVVFGNSSYDNGRSASIGFVGSIGRYEASYRTPSVADNDYIDLIRELDTDEYKFAGTAGQKVSVAFDALWLSNSAIGGTTVQLLNVNNVVLAQASRHPIGPTGTVANYDLGLANYSLPATGSYSVRVVGSARQWYYLSITKDLAIDTENGVVATTPRIAVALPGSVLGYLAASDIRDLFSIQMSAGQKLRLTLTRPDNNAKLTPLNDLVPLLAVLRPNGILGSYSSAFNSAGAIVVDYTATETGQHAIDVRRVSGSGAYAVKAALLAAVAAQGEGEKLVTNAATNALLVQTEGNPSSISAPMIERPAVNSISTLGWQNPKQPVDVSGDNRVTALDALLLFNELNSRRVASIQLPPKSSASAVDQFFDTNGDGVITPLDALLIVDYLNKQ